MLSFKLTSNRTHFRSLFKPLAKGLHAQVGVLSSDEWLQGRRGFLIFIKKVVVPAFQDSLEGGMKV